MHHLLEETAGGGRPRPPVLQRHGSGGALPPRRITMLSSFRRRLKKAISSPPYVRSRRSLYIHTVDLFSKSIPAGAAPPATGSSAARRPPQAGTTARRAAASPPLLPIVSACSAARGPTGHTARPSRTNPRRKRRCAARGGAVAVALLVFCSRSGYPSSEKNEPTRSASYRPAAGSRLSSCGSATAARVVARRLEERLRRRAAQVPRNWAPQGSWR